MKAVAQFVQQGIRYVSIDIRNAGWQPHPAAETFAKGYGDCKDKAALMRTMLRELGVETCDVSINMQRGSIGPDTPAYRGFDHAITAIRLPDGLTDSSLMAVINHPKYGKILFFDPTDELMLPGRSRRDPQASSIYLIDSKKLHGLCSIRTLYPF